VNLTIIWRSLLFASRLVRRYCKGKIAMITLKILSTTAQTLVDRAPNVCAPLVYVRFGYLCRVIFGRPSTSNTSRCNRSFAQDHVQSATDLSRKMTYKVQQIFRTSSRTGCNIFRARLRTGCNIFRTSSRTGCNRPFAQDRVHSATL